MEHSDVSSEGDRIENLYTQNLKSTLNENPIDLEETTNTKNLTIYTDFSNGSIYEYHGYKAYIDSRAEVFLKKLNKKSDVYQESLDIMAGKMDADSFIDKYKFDYMVVREDAYIYTFAKHREDYIEVFHDKNKHLFKRK